MSSEIDRLRSEMEELFADLCRMPRLVRQRAGFRPAVDVYRTDDPPAVVVLVELAGVDPGDVDLVLHDGVLTISGARRRDTGARRYHHMEIDYGTFERRVQLRDPVDSDAISASYDHGMLRIVLPVAARSQGAVPVRITAREGR